MLPFIGTEHTRRINLGGSSRVSSASDLLDSVRAQREARLEQKRRQDAAVRLQSFWRGRNRAAKTKEELRRVLQSDVLGLTGLRCLVLLGLDEEALGLWSQSVAASSPDQVFGLAKSPKAVSWLTLVRKSALLLLTSVSRSPESQYASTHLQALQILLSPDAASSALGTDGHEVTAAIATYLIVRDYYALISEAIRRIPETKAKKEQQGPVSALISLSTTPFSIYAPSSPFYGQSISLLFTHILSIPLLPNRIPLSALPTFVAHLPFNQLDTVAASSHRIIQHTTVDQKIHILANTSMFFTPHYAKFPASSLVWYLQFMSEIFGALPPGVFDRAIHRTKKGKGPQQAAEGGKEAAAWNVYESDDDGTPRTAGPIEISTDYTPQLDSKTLTRLQKIPSQTHIEALLGLARRHGQKVQDAFVAWVLALGYAWPGRRELVLSIILAVGGEGGGSLIKSLWRFEVRAGPLGKDEKASTLFDPKNARFWPPLLFLSELYSQALLTMGDDEFFANASSSVTSGFRNPLSLDELVVFSRQLLNVAFTLYWTSDDARRAYIREGAAEGVAGYTWEEVREKVTKCLVAIHARDSRKSFIPPDGWLVASSALDMRTFLHAAVMEEQQLVTSSEEDLSPPPTSHRQHHQSRRVQGFSARTIASLSPCLGVLNNIPFAVPFEVRVAIFRQFVGLDMQRRGIDDRYGGAFGRSEGWFGRRTKVRVRRGMVAQDGFDRLGGGDVDLKGPVEITFVDQFGQEEAGIDGGGVFKEFFTDLCKEVFDTDRGLWLANKKNELYPNPHAYATEPHSLNWYRFIGRILGKAMYEGILVDVAFAGFFLAKWLGKQSFLDDLASLDPDLYKGLIFLKHYQGNPEDLSLNFTIAVDELGVTKNVELVPGGSDISVTKENRLKYITLVSHYRLSRQIRKQSEAFFEGLKEMIEARWLRMFNQQEVQILIGGVNSPIDLDDLREHTNYGGLFDDRHPVIVAFWKVVNGFNQEERRALLRFVTSCSRPPLLGFKELVPNFSIRDAGTDSLRLPTSSTCVNLLKLPQYANERVMREKILQAITSGAGFDLS